VAQILAKSGYDAYLFCRPGQNECPLEDAQFVWEGYDGSRVLATRAKWGYNTHRGKARRKAEQLMHDGPEDRPGIVLWGVGNHGGGASRLDLRRLGDLIRKTKDVRLFHSSADAYFRDLKRHADSLPVHRDDLNPWAVGCYTSQIRIKQKHRLLENELYSTEKMAAAAWSQGRMRYPTEDFRNAMHDLATAEFHDILPGSSIKPAEDAALRMLDHGIEILSRVKARTFFALSQGQPKARGDEIPVFVYNPHPFPVKTTVECEFQLPDQNWGETFTDIRVFSREKALPAQVEKEESSIAIDWRKRVVFAAELAPSQMNRFDCRPRVLPRRPGPGPQPRGGRIRFRTSKLDAVISTRTGLMDRCRINGINCLKKGACRPLVMKDNEDPWGMTVRSFRNKAGAFKTLPAGEAARFAGVKERRLRAVRLVEDGQARMVVEALMGYKESRMCLRYKLPKRGTEIEIEARVHWNERDRMLKLSVPTRDRKAKLRGQVAYGVQDLPTNGDEVVAQKWLAIVMRKGRDALTVINDGTYGADMADGELRLSLLRSPAYSGHPIRDRDILPQDRYNPRIDQGERVFRFWINAGPAAGRLASADREALVRNEKPMALSFYPAGGGPKPKPLVVLSDKAVRLAAAKRAESGRALILRLFEPTGRRRTTAVSLPFAGMRKTITLGGFEIRTYRVDIRRRTWTVVNLLEK
jgi:alpha-mannosidase